MLWELYWEISLLGINRIDGSCSQFFRQSHTVSRVNCFEGRELLGFEEMSEVSLLKRIMSNKFKCRCF
jgi:hypothetical protein